jgi:hypothetical protein
VTEEHLAATQASYDAVAAAYADQLSDELRRKPLDRALLTAFAEQVRAATPAQPPAADPARASAATPARASALRSRPARSDPDRWRLSPVRRPSPAAAGGQASPAAAGGQASTAARARSR